MERIIISVLSDELDKMKKKNSVLEIKLDNGELLRIMGESIQGTFIWTVSHVLQRITRKYFQDIDSDSKNEIIDKVINYPIKYIDIFNGGNIYSRQKTINRLNEIKFKLI